MKKPKPDFTQVAFRIAQQAAHLDAPPAAHVETLSPKAAAGRKGGLKGGNARAEKLTAAERSASAQKAARKRWEKESA